jgi:hypothetical protein
MDCAILALKNGSLWMRTNAQPWALSVFVDLSTITQILHYSKTVAARLCDSPEPWTVFCFGVMEIHCGAITAIVTRNGPKFANSDWDSKKTQKRSHM